MAALNIKNEEVVRKVKELAELEGASMTTVVMAAVQDRLDRQRESSVNEARMEYWLAFGKRVRKQMDPDLLGKDLTEDLYDERGLPA